MWGWNYKTVDLVVRTISICFFPFRCGVSEFIQRISDLLIYLLPHYIHEGKSYLTIAFGCTGGHHRSVMIAEQIHKNLTHAGYRSKVSHRDLAKPV